jgi:hypothetical protein
MEGIMSTLFWFTFVIACSEDKVTDTITLDNCTTSIDDEVPTFFQKYFHCVEISIDGSEVVIETDGLPPHKSYYYGEGSPNYTDWDDSRGDEYSPNPPKIAEQNIIIRIPLEPTSNNLSIDSTLVDREIGSSDYEYKGKSPGVALDGVSIFIGLAAPGDDIEDEKYTFDEYNAHPEMSGTYHYHTDTRGPLEVLEYKGLIDSTTPGDAEIELYGIMCDGTLILGCNELNGSQPNSDELDVQNGHNHDLVDDEGTTHFVDRYHTHICIRDFPDFQFTPEIQYYRDCDVEH